MNFKEMTIQLFTKLEIDQFICANRFLIVIAVISPGIGGIGITPFFPKPQLVFGQELDALDPFGAFPGV